MGQGGQLGGPGRGNYVGQGGEIRWAREGQLGEPGKGNKVGQGGAIR